MTNVIVVGYPKSGNTWVVRLVAELIACPVVGFWQSDHHEIAREGLNRKSDFQCFKSHHQLHEILDNDSSNQVKIIYVIRDPRDIVLSGAEYFPIDPWPVISQFLIKLPLVGYPYRRLMQILIPERYRIKKMVEAVLYGSARVHHWVRISWKNHYTPYLDQGYFFVKYENLLVTPEYECKRILGFLGLQRDDGQIREAIQRQSFKVRKEEFLRKNEMEKARFMRAGESGEWEKKLSKRQKKLFLKNLTDDFKLFSYPAKDSI